MPDDQHLDDDLFGFDVLEPGDIAPDLIELEKIPRRAWEQTLAPLHRSLRGHAARQIRDERLRNLAWELVNDLDAADMQRQGAGDIARHRARTTAAPLPSPGVGSAAARPTAQVNLRLRRDDYARLQEAATAVGLKPTSLARALVLNGVAKVLQEQRAG